MDRALASQRDSRNWAYLVFDGNRELRGIFSEYEPAKIFWKITCDGGLVAKEYIDDPDVFEVFGLGEPAPLPAMFDNKVFVVLADNIEFMAMFSDCVNASEYARSEYTVQSWTIDEDNEFMTWGFAGWELTALGKEYNTTGKQFKVAASIPRVVADIEIAAKVYAEDKKRRRGETSAAASAAPKASYRDKWRSNRKALKRKFKKALEENDEEELDQLGRSIVEDLMAASAPAPATAVPSSATVVPRAEWQVSHDKIEHKLKVALENNDEQSYHELEKLLEQHVASMPTAAAVATSSVTVTVPAPALPDMETVAPEFEERYRVLLAKKDALLKELEGADDEVLSVVGALAKETLTGGGIIPLEGIKAAIITGTEELRNKNTAVAAPAPAPATVPDPVPLTTTEEKAEKDRLVAEIIGLTHAGAAPARMPTAIALPAAPPSFVYDLEVEPPRMPSPRDAPTPALELSDTEDEIEDVRSVVDVTTPVPQAVVTDDIEEDEEDIEVPSDVDDQLSDDCSDVEEATRSMNYWKDKARELNINPRLWKTVAAEHFAVAQAVAGIRD